MNNDDLYDQLQDAQAEIEEELAQLPKYTHLQVSLMRGTHPQYYNTLLRRKALEQLIGLIPMEHRLEI